MKFDLDLKEIQQLSEWDLDHQECKNSNVGAIGGRLQFSIVPTGLGTILKVKCAVCGKELDLTDYSEF